VTVAVDRTQRSARSGTRRGAALGRIRRRLVLMLALLLTAAFGLSSCAGVGSDGKQKLIIAEPIHSIGYLPLYAAMESGAFADRGLDVKTTTLTGGAHVNGVLNDSTWGFIGGPESGAVANVKGADLEAIGGVVNKANIYWAASPDSGVTGDDLAGSLKGKRFAVGRHGGSPEVLTIHKLKELGLDPEKDVTLVNNDTSGSELSLVAAGQADVAVTTEPVLGRGIKQGLWGEPVANFPEELGEYPYSAIVVSRATVQKDPETAKRFLAALGEGIDLVNDDRDRAAVIASGEFPSVSGDIVQNTLDRAYEDNIWSGLSISDRAQQNNIDISEEAGILPARHSADEVTVDSILDLSYLPKGKR
jgi:NitT/TauT family transport system substrate-binding protein